MVYKDALGIWCLDQAYWHELLNLIIENKNNMDNVFEIFIARCLFKRERERDRDRERDGIWN
jgi:hypothetical protein